MAPGRNGLGGAAGPRDPQCQVPSFCGFSSENRWRGGLAPLLSEGSGQWETHSLFQKLRPTAGHTPGPDSCPAPSSHRIPEPLRSLLPAHRT